MSFNIRFFMPIVLESQASTLDTLISSVLKLKGCQKMPKKILTVIPVWYNVNGEQMKRATPQEWLIPGGLVPVSFDTLFTPRVHIYAEDSPFTYNLEFLLRIRDENEDALGAPNPNAIE